MSKSQTRKITATSHHDASSMEVAKEEEGVTFEMKIGRCYKALLGNPQSC